MMLPIGDKVVVANVKLNTFINLWFYLSIEYLIGIAISTFLTLLVIVKSFLPKPPRNLTGDVVLIAGVSSTFGESLAEKFAEVGCSVICVDNDLRSMEEITARLRSRYCGVEEIGPNHRKHESQNAGPVMAAYKCDLLDRDAIRKIAEKVEDEVGYIDVLVTCAGLPDQDIFDTASTTLMSHYWTVLAFLPSLMRRDGAYVIGITPISSIHDAYTMSRAAIASLMENLGQELSNRNSHLNFLAFSPTAEHSSTRQSEQQVAKEIIEAIKRGQYSISWSSRLLYKISCMIYSAITTLTQWLRTQGCDYSF